MIFKRKKERNFTFEEITLNRWIKCSEGDLSYIAKNGKLNSESVDSWHKIQDDYLLLFGGDSDEMKQYKRVCTDYVNALAEWIENPNLVGKQYTLVNDLYIEKEQLQSEIFKVEVEKMNFSDLIARVSIKIRMRIEKDKYTAKEFFELIKALNHGGETN